jgi:UDP-2,3-diacylglucosamine hydrolase
VSGVNAPAVPPMAELNAPPSWHIVDFISDLHLGADAPATFTAWRHYLESTPADAVFILGDLFEVWVGDDAVSGDPLSTAVPPSTASFEDRCARVLGQTASRLALFFMHGNRDFLVGQRLMDLCHGTLLSDPTVLVFEGQRWLLSHGDALCLDDADYMQFRQQVRSPAWQRAFLAKPLAERQAIARELRQQSQRGHRRRPPVAEGGQRTHPDSRPHPPTGDTRPRPELCTRGTQRLGCPSPGAARRSAAPARQRLETRCPALSRSVPD